MLIENYYYNKNLDKRGHNWILLDKLGLDELAINRK